VKTTSIYLQNCQELGLGLSWAISQVATLRLYLILLTASGLNHDLTIFQAAVAKTKVEGNYLLRALILGWNHLQHTRIAIEFARWNFFIVFKLESNEKL